METRYKRGLNHTYLILELPMLYEEDYQMKMMQANSIEGLLMVTGKGIEGKSQYFYEISEMVSMKSRYENREMTREELEQFLVQFLGVLDQIQRYLLDMNRILLEPEYIFYRENTYCFCYLPVQEAELCKEFHKLTEYFVSKISHKEQQGIFLAYDLHRETMEENYNLERIVKRLQGKEEKQTSYIQPEIVEEPYEDDWIDYQEGNVQVLRESSVKWRKTKNKWKQRYDDRWGDWEG